jgi:hypothetical protein
VTSPKRQSKKSHTAALAGAGDDTNQLLSVSRKSSSTGLLRRQFPFHSDVKVPNEFFQSLSGAIESSSASVVMLSECFHNCREMMTLHHAIIEHLVGNLGFTIVASESGLPESRVISNHLQLLRKLSRGEEDELWTKGLNKMYSAWTEGRDLIDWMVAHNQLESDNLIDYCGLDIGGFYSDWTYPLSKIQSYIKQHFPHFERDWSEQMNPLLGALGTTKARDNYQHILTAGEKNKLAQLLDELVNMMSLKRVDLQGDVDFEWTRQSAISVSKFLIHFLRFWHKHLSNFQILSY